MFLRKPKNPVVQRSHPLAREILAAWLFPFSQTFMYDTLINRRNKYMTSDGTWAGNGINFSAGSVQNMFITWDNATLPEFRTFALRFTPYTNTGTFMNWGGSWNDAFPYFISSFNRTYIDANWNITYSNTNFILGQENTYILTQTSDRLWHVYLNGRELGSYDDGGSTTRATGETQFLIGRGFDGSPNVTAHAVYVYGRGMTANEAADLHRDFYAPFRPKRQRAFSVVVGTAPTAPSGLTATTASSSQINCAWTDNSSDETGFELQYDTDSGFGSATTVTPAANATSYNVTGLSPSTLYYFRIRAVNGAGNSAYTATASDTTDAAATALPVLLGSGLFGGLQTMSGGLS